MTNFTTLGLTEIRGMVQTTFSILAEMKSLGPSGKPDIGWALGQRLQHWPNAEPTSAGRVRASTRPAVYQIVSEESRMGMRGRVLVGIQGVKKDDDVSTTDRPDPGRDSHERAQQSRHFSPDHCSRAGLITSSPSN